MAVIPLHLVDSKKKAPNVLFDTNDGGGPPAWTTVVEPVAIPVALSVSAPIRLPVPEIYLYTPLIVQPRWSGGAYFNSREYSSTSAQDVIMPADIVQY